MTQLLAAARSGLLIDSFGGTGQVPAYAQLYAGTLPNLRLWQHDRSQDRGACWPRSNDDDTGHAVNARGGLAACTVC